MIEARLLKKKYNNGTYALKGISFKFDKKTTSIIGRNGAGKTTLLKILSTQLLPTSGTASVNDYDILNQAEDIRKSTVSIPQEARPVDWVSTLNNVLVYLSARGMESKKAEIAAEKALKSVDLWGVRDKASAELSGGMKRKIFVAMAIASDADIVFLDEPTTGLDPLSRIEIWAAIKKMRGQIILTTHYMEEAQALSDEVLMLDDGKIFSQGRVNDLLRPFEGLVRVESNKMRRSSYKVGNAWVSYVKKKKAESFVMEGDIIKPITLDDLFIKKGVNLES
jgi:ABC-2 type transport system ATP-binding protein